VNAEPRHARLQGAGVGLHATIAGDGPPVLLLHGFPEHWRSWRGLMGPLADAGFRAIAPDLRGYNESDRPLARDAYRMEALVADVAALARGSGAARVRVVGHDWGGVIAWVFAAVHPELVERLAILNAPHPVLYRRRLAHPDQLVRSWYVGVFQVPGLAERLLAARDFALLRRMFTGTARPGTFSREQLDAYADAMRPPGALTAALEYYRANLRGRPVAALPPVTAPTLVVWGERDAALSVRLLDGLHHVAPHLTVRRLPHAGHWVHHEARNEVLQALVPFLHGQ
jgi:pimeloyl-ACP methyl ester carboxylesterase